MSIPTLDCPLPLADYPRITLAHGGGGRLTQRLQDELFLPAFGGALLRGRHDGARLPPCAGQLAFSTDAHVVKPLVFPGGNIGTLAVHGTANDLAMCGARARYLAASFVIEEGLETALLWRIACAMGDAARAAGIEIAAGDTKVVERGKGDGLYISTAGVGEILAPHPIEPVAIRPGDRILLSGDLGRHGIAVMAAREGFAFETTIESDCAALWPLVAALIEQRVAVHCLRDLTRGGLAAALCEIAGHARLDLAIDEACVPVTQPVRAACEILGLDPLLVANEGRLVAFVPPQHADIALATIRALPLGAGAVDIGRVADESAGKVWLRTLYGQERLLLMPSGEQLPRIC